MTIEVGPPSSANAFFHGLGRELPTVFAPDEWLKVVSGVHFAEMPCDEP